LKAVILAAGLGTRMSKFFPNTPKVMLPIRERPLLERNIVHLKKYGFDQIYINLHYLPDVIKNYFDDGKKFGVEITYSYEPNILGTSGALTNLKKFLTETFLVLYGDIFTTLDFKKFLQFHKDKRSQATLLIHKTDHPQDSDLIAIGKDNKIYHFYISPHKELPTNTDFSNAGIYLLEPETLKFLPKKIPSDFVEDFFPILLEKNFRLFGYASCDYTKDIGTLDRYKQVLEYCQKHG